MSTMPADRWTSFSRAAVLGAVAILLALHPALGEPGTAARESGATGSHGGGDAKGDAVLTRLPVAFVPNAGQFDADVLFVSSLPGAAVAFSSSGLALELSQQSPAASHSAHRGAPDRALGSALEQPRSRSAGARVEFVDASPVSTIVGTNRLPGVANFYLGSDPATWREGVPTYAGIAYRDLYRGVHLHYEAHDAWLKGTFVVSPGTDPSVIRWRYPGAEDVRLDAGSRQLRIEFRGGEAAAHAQDTGVGPMSRYARPGIALLETAPVAWQTVLGQRRAVQAQYEVADDGTVGFALGAYDSTQRLVIDPTLLYSTLIGGSEYDWGPGNIEVDDEGSMYFGGSTGSPYFPTASPIQPRHGAGVCGGIPCHDVVVVKLNREGDALLFSTYLGGGDEDQLTQHAIDDTGHVLLTGHTRSADFPVANALQPAYAGGDGDAFVAKLSSTGGGLVFSTYLGGSRAEHGMGVDMGDDGSVYAVGLTSSPDFPTTAGAYQTLFMGAACRLAATTVNCDDMYVTKLAPGGDRVVYSTFLGGTARDVASAVTVDAAGSAYVTGWSDSIDFPTVNAYQDGPTPSSCDRSSRWYWSDCQDVIVAKLDATGSALQYSTYLGGSNRDLAFGLAVDDSGRAVVHGDTLSSDYPVSDAVQPTFAGGSGPAAGASVIGDAFVTRLSPGGDTLEFSTYLGGAAGEVAEDIALDDRGNIYVVGGTASDDFPTVNPIQDAHQGPMPGNQRTYPRNFSFQGDGYVAMLDQSGRRLAFSTFLGGPNSDSITGVAVDDAGTIHVRGYTYSGSAFPLVDPLQDYGRHMLFVAKIGVETTVPTPTPLTPTPTVVVTPSREALTPTATGTATATATATSTHTLTPQVTRTPQADCVCGIVRGRVAKSTIDSALADPDLYYGWMLPLDQGKPPGPVNPPRNCLTLTNPNLDYHPLWNTPIWRVGCP